MQLIHELVSKQLTYLANVSIQQFDEHNRACTNNKQTKLNYYTTYKS